MLFIIEVSRGSSSKTSSAEFLRMTNFISEFLIVAASVSEFFRVTLLLFVFLRIAASIDVGVVTFLTVTSRITSAKIIHVAQSRRSSWSCVLFMLLGLSLFFVFE
jgi:hypothetical protein